MEAKTEAKKTENPKAPISSGFRITSMPTVPVAPKAESSSETSSEAPKKRAPKKFTNSHSGSNTKYKKDEGGSRGKKGGKGFKKSNSG